MLLVVLYDIEQHYGYQQQAQDQQLGECMKCLVLAPVYVSY